MYKVTHNSTKVVRAAKRIEKRKRSIESLEEFSILRKLDHPNIIRIYDIYAERKYLYIVMDYCQGGELFDRIIEKGSLTENEAKHYMKQLLSAIHHCHSNQIMHRDLKPENIVFLNAKAQDLKIIDFGVGTSFGNDKATSLKVGSVGVPPLRYTTWPPKSSRRITATSATSGPWGSSSTSSSRGGPPSTARTTGRFTRPSSRDRCPSPNAAGRTLVGGPGTWWRR